MKKFILTHKIILLFISILFLGSVLRSWDLGKTPLSPTWDEVALGYNAYSIFETGKDEFGKTLPVVMRSFDDYKPAFYTYLIIPSYKIFGLNEFSVRLPSAIMGILTLVSVYFLIKKLFKRESIALLTMLLLAISPWHIQFSRVAFETNVGLALNVFAATFFLYGLKRHWMLLLAALFAGLSVHTYQSDRVFTPLFILGMIIIFWKQFFTVPRKFIIWSFIIGFVVILPFIITVFTDSNTLLRAKGTSVFSNNVELLKNNATRNELNIETGDTLGKIIDNRRIVYAKAVLDGYLSHFNSNWLLKGDIARHHAPEMGLIYLWEFPFILIGIYLLIFSKFDKKTKFFVFFWFLLAPLPASITTGVPHAVRTFNFLPTWQIFTALGILGMYSSVSNFKYKVLRIRLEYIVVLLLVLFAIFNFIYYLNQYFVQQNYFHARDWLHGHREMISEMLKREENYSKVLITDKEPMDRASMFFLFYSQYPPEEYQKVSPQSGGFAVHPEFDKYIFRPIDWEKDSTLKDTLIVGLPSEIPQKEAIYTVYYPNGDPALVMAER